LRDGRRRPREAARGRGLRGGHAARGADRVGARRAQPVQHRADQGGRARARDRRRGRRHGERRGGRHGARGRRRAHEHGDRGRARAGVVREALGRPASAAATLAFREVIGNVVAIAVVALFLVAIVAWAERGLAPLGLLPENARGAAGIGFKTYIGVFPLFFLA